MILRLLRIIYVAILLYIIIKLLYVSKESFENPSDSLDAILADTPGGSVAETKLLNATNEANAEIGALAAAEADGELEATDEELNYGEGGEPAWTEDLERAEDAFYGQAKHAISGTLIPVQYNGATISNPDPDTGQAPDKYITGAFTPGWVDRRNDDAREAMKAEDLESTDDSFSRNYALWKCIEEKDECTAVIYARDGSKFALFKSIEGAIISKNDPNEIPNRTGEAGTFQTQLAAGPTKENLVKKDGGEGGGEPDYDVLIIDSSARLANEMLARNMIEVQGDNWVGGNDKFINASLEAVTACIDGNYGVNGPTDPNYECTVTSCRKKDTENGTKWKCKAKPRARLGAQLTYNQWEGSVLNKAPSIVEAETLIEAEGPWYPKDLTENDPLETKAQKYKKAGELALVACVTKNPNMDTAKFACYVTSSRTNYNEDDPTNPFLQVRSKAKPRAIGGMI
tara:strand:+ start:490 stop:1860 length:1371 start_codon:yes stop_codon:yes gene_type:complete